MSLYASFFYYYFYFAKNCEAGKLRMNFNLRFE